MKGILYMDSNTYFLGEKLTIAELKYVQNVISNLTIKLGRIPTNSDIFHYILEQAITINSTQTLK